MILNQTVRKSEHLKGQLGPPVSDEKGLFVTKTEPHDPARLGLAATIIGNKRSHTYNTYSPIMYPPQYIVEPHGTIQTVSTIDQQYPYI